MILQTKIIMLYFLDHMLVLVGCRLLKNNFEKAMIVHAVRRIPKASWLNDRDQFMQPKEDVIKDNEFVTQCVIWGLFSDSNNTVSISNVKYKKLSLYQNQIIRIWH